MLAGLGKGESRIAVVVAPPAPDPPADRERRREQVAELQAAAQDLVTREPGRALAAAELAVTLARQVDNPTRLAATRVLGRALFASGRYRDSSAVLKRLAAAHERRGQLVAAAGAHSGRIASLLYVGRPAEALDAAARARTYFRRAGDRVGMAKLDVNTGIIFHRLDRMPEALACYRRARRTFRREGDPHHLAVIDLNCALAHSALGRQRRAVALFERARQRFEQTGQTTLLVSTDYNRACDEFSNGRYERAWCAMEHVRGAFESLGDRYGIALADLDLAEMALALGAADRALGLGRRAGQGFVALGIGLEAARARRLEAVALARTGSPVQARRALEQSLAGFVAEGRSIGAARVTLDLAALLVEADPARAARLARAGGTALRRAGFGKDAVRALLIEGRALATSEPRRARALLGRAARLARRRGIAGVDWQSDAALAGMARAGGDLVAERRLLNRALGAIDRMRTDVRRLDLATWVLADCGHLYEDAIRACLVEGPRPVADGLADRILVYAERARSRALADALAAAGSTAPAASGSAAERAPVARLRRSLDDHYRALHHRRRFDLVEDDVLGAIDHEERELSRALGGWERLRMGQPADLPQAAALRAALAPGQELVEYQRLGEELVAIVARRDGATVVRLPGRVGDVARRIQDFAYQIRTFAHGADFVSRHAAALASATEQVLAELGSLLVAPIEPFLSGRSLVFVPTGDLHGIPFAALRRAGRYLIETRTVSVAPSALVLSWIRARRRPPALPPLVIGVGDELAPEVREEAREVAGLFAGSLLLVGAEADRATVSREIAGRSLVHVAAHGYFRPERPTLSSLQLADGCLTLHDVLGLKVAADLITLAACHSGQSRVGAGDEIVGLARGFLQAGARSVLASHWALDDASARRLMRAFYRGYQAGKGKAGALRLAMLEVMARERHPYYWAPFGLIGAA